MVQHQSRILDQRKRGCENLLPWFGVIDQTVKADLEKVDLRCLWQILTWVWKVANKRLPQMTDDRCQRFRYCQGQGQNYWTTVNIGPNLNKAYCCSSFWNKRIRFLRRFLNQSLSPGTKIDHHRALCFCVFARCCHTERNLTPFALIMETWACCLDLNSRRARPNLQLHSTTCRFEMVMYHPWYTV